MNEKLQQLREQLAKEEASLKENSGSVCHFSEGGPVSVALVKALIEAVEAQAQEIERLSARLDRLGDRPDA